MFDGGVLSYGIWAEVLSGLLRFVFVMAKGYCLLYFLDHFLESRFAGSVSGKRRYRFLFLLIYGLLQESIHRLFPMSGYTDTNYESLMVILNVILGFGAVYFVSIVFYKVRRRITLFLAVSFLAVNEIIFLGFYTIWYWLFGWITTWECGLFEKGYIGLDALTTMMNITGYATLFLLYGVILSVLFYGALKNIVRFFREKEYEIHKTELLFLLTPSFAGLLICVLLRSILIIVEDGVSTFLYDRYPLLIVLIPGIMLFSLLSILYGIKLFQDMIQFNREKNSRVILENQINTMQQHMEEMEHIYSGLRGMKHDMRNTVSVIMRLAAQEDKNIELQDYLAELNKSFDRLEFCFRTGNTVVDTLLTMKKHEINRLMPDLQMDADRLLFPDSLLIHSYDIGVILGNALDNAIEACRKLREKENITSVFINLSSFQKGKMFFLEIKNSCYGNAVRKTREGFPQTDKANTDGHGIGLANIRNAAAKYHGAVDWSIHENIFTLSVMMKNERGMENHVY